MRGQSKAAKNLRTDGVALYSYALMIGITENGRKVALDYTRTGGAFRSMTTSAKHVCPAKRAAHVVMRPADYFQQ